MNTKECIEYLNYLKNYSGNYRKKELDEVIERIKMWEEFKEGYRLMNEFEEKYFQIKNKKKIEIEMELEKESDELVNKIKDYIKEINGIDFGICRYFIKNVKEMIK